MKGMQGGWQSEEGQPRISAVSWSPKGKQIALGLESGDVLTFTLSNKDTPQKHIPPTSLQTPLVSMQWIGPAYTFRTVYCSQAQNDEPVHHIVALDTRVGALDLIQLDAGFSVTDRYPPSSIIFSLPKWNNEDSLLVIAGDAAASDFEVLGHANGEWYQEASDNPLAVPMKDSFEENVLIGLAVDLTDSVPTMVAYMDDGTLQLWAMENPNAYPGLVTPSAVEAPQRVEASASVSMPTAPQSVAPSVSSGSTVAPSAMEQSVSGMSMDEPKSAVQESAPTSAFSPPSFGQTPTPSFGQTSSPSPFSPPTPGSSSPFGQPATPSAFGQTSTPSAFGQPSAPSVFGKPSGFGQSAFGQTSSNGSAFGQSSGNTSGFGQSSSNTSAFGQTSNPASAFGKPAFGQSSFGQSAFGQTSTPAFGQTSTPAFAFGQASAFGQPSFGATSKPATPGGFGGTGFGQTAQPAGFGQTSQPAGFGQTTQPASAGKGFGAFANSGTSAFGQTSTPSTGGGFGAFSGAGKSAFGQGGFGAAPAAPQATPKPTTSPPDSPVDDSAMDSMGSLGLGGSDSPKEEKPAAGGLFGNATPSAQQDKPAGSPFGAPASSSPFGSSAIKPASGFGAFSGFQPTGGAFAPKDNKEAPKPTFGAGAFAGMAKPASGFGSSGFGQTATPGSASGSAFGQSSFGKPAFGQSAFGQSGFGQPAAGGKPAFGQSSFGTAPATGGFGAFASKPASLVGTPAAKEEDKGAGKPAAGGFGAFASRTASFTASPGESKPFGGFGTGGGFSEQDKGEKPSTPKEEKPCTPKEEKPAEVIVKQEPQSPVAPPPAPVPVKSEEAESPPVKVEERSPSPSPKPLKAPETPATPIKAPEPAAVPATPLTPETPQEKDVKPKSGFGFNLQASPSPFTTPAFGQPSTPTSSYIKPAAGFGSAGVVSPGSPFANPSKASTSGSAFGSAFKKFETPKTEATAAPTFGAPSIPGLRKSAFPTTPTGPTAAKEPSSGGFAAFSNNTSPFKTPPDAPKTSFKDMLKGKDRVPEPTKPAVFSPATEKPKTPTDTRKSAFPPSPAKDEESTTPAGTPVSRPPVFKPKEEKEGGSSKALSETKSGSLSSVGSFVDVSKEDASEGEEGEEEEAEEEGEDFLSDLSQSEGDSTDELPSTTPSKPPPRERSASTTPKPPSRVVDSDEEPPSDESDEEESDEGDEEEELEDVTEESGLSTIPEESSTPPESPVKRPSKASEPPGSISSGLRPPGSGIPFNLGLGKAPASRPVRSSPLANAYNASDSESEDKTEKKPVATAQGKEATPPPEAPPSRTGTPPLLSNFGFGGKSRQSATPSPTNVPPSASRSVSPAVPATTAPAASTPLAPMVSTPIAPTTKSVFGAFLSTPKPGEPSSPASGSASPSTTSTPFGAMKPPATPGFPSSSSSGFFGAAKAPAPVTPSTPSGLFGSAIPPSTTPTGPNLMSQLGKFAMPAPAPSGSMQPPVPLFVPAAQPPPPPRPVTPPQEGMQKECAELVTGIERELKQLGELAAEAKQQLKQLSDPIPGSKRREDLVDAAKWSLGDLALFGRTLMAFSKDLTELKAARDKERQLVKELRASMLKANTRKEEIARFSKAQSDPEFAKMLKTRTLGPEHLETQTNLRRNLRIVRDRVQALEDNLNALKKKLSQQKSGKVSIRPPTLDVLNRTYRNIDLAINNDRELIDSLTARMANVSFGEGRSRAAKLKDANRRDSRLPDPNPRPLNVTPNVAVTTAAALNAERSAARLKRVLLAARPEPLLNKTAATAPAPPAVFQTPMKPGATPRTPAFDPKDAMWADFGEDKFSPQTPTPAGRRGAGSGVRRHQPSPAVKKVPLSTPSPPPNFSWGPLPPPRAATSGSGGLPVPIVKLT
ncbi:hypothetical protein EV121DRAFT_282457 [Schizophyllum commune]